MQFSFRPTLLGRSLILAISELAANAICWIVAGILFGRNSDTRPILSLALLAWVIAYIRIEACTRCRSYQVINIYDVTPVYPLSDTNLQSAIDNATRGLISLGQLPVTCGLFFSLGHSTIVIVVTVAIAISSDVFEKMHDVGEVGGIVGSAVSGSFLFIVGLGNTVILWRILMQRRREAINDKRRAEGEAIPDTEYKPHHNHMLMMRILGPIMTFVNRPWKMYPVGVLFGFGFDTASSIALLALTAIAKRGEDGKLIPSSNIVILPLLFTAGMTLVDSTDSILMLYSYSGFPEHSLRLFERSSSQPHVNVSDLEERSMEAKALGATERENDLKLLSDKTDAVETPPNTDTRHSTGDLNDKISRDIAIKMNVMSGLSIILTLMSILVAFSISLITIMGLIGAQCGRCSRAADAEDGGGLEGSWWRAWARANDNSGYIGVAIVGSFLVVVAVWYGIRKVAQKIAAKEVQTSASRPEL